VRVTADFSVPDGSRIEDLGINFRRIVRDILARCVEPQMASARPAPAHTRRARAAGGAAARAAPRPTLAPGARRPWWRRLLGGPETPAAPAGDAPPNDDARQLAAWERAAQSDPDPVRRAACAALRRVVGSIVARHGTMWGDRAVLASVATDVAGNALGAERIGAWLDPMLRRAAAETPYVLLPRQERPVVMNTKGASASGKSTLRPLQRRLAGDIGVAWSEFALISPDIWRKQLLDYASLGEHYKYGGAFTGDELAIIDQKLDRYIAAKGERGDMPHLLIDRFRFDSFAPDSDEPGSNLLTRFGRLVYLFFLITPPESLVERAWKRGLEVGRYKAVDDILAHGVEAYTGMPELFFTWIERRDKRVHFEFLDNSVRLGERPRTVAFGWNGDLNVLDVARLLDVERFRRVDVEARSAQALYPDALALAPEANTGFLRQCVARCAATSFASQASGRIYLRLEAGRLAWVDRDALAAAIADDDTHAALRAVIPAAFASDAPAPPGAQHLSALSGPERIHTLGEWGSLA
jgi:hypothetical protein